MAAPRFDLIVVGEGVAGLTCARRAAELGLTCATIEATAFGGLILNVNKLDPPPADGPSAGAEFASAIAEANATLGVHSQMATVSAVRRSGGAFEVIAEDGAFAAPHVVIASGATRTTLGVPGEAELSGKGVSQCADCDGPLYKNQDVVVVGGGDSALQESLALAHYCRTVYLVHRRDHFRADPRFAARIAGVPAIQPILQHEVTRVLGEGGVTGVMLRDCRSGELRELACTAFFAYVGLRPNADYLPPEVARNPDGSVVAGPDLQTSVPGLYAIGAVRAGFGGTIFDAMRDAETVAQAAAVQRLPGSYPGRRRIEEA